MDIDPKTYPSRTFARFTAHNQLLADVTGQTIVSSVQRLGGKSYLQEVIPDGEAPSIANNPDAFSAGFQIGMSVNTANSGSIQLGGNRQPSDSFDEDAGLEKPQTSNPAPGIDEALFEEVVKTTLNPNRFPELYQSCGTQEAAMAVEARVAAEIVTAYRHIKQKQDCPIVQNLNKLL